MPIAFWCVLIAGLLPFAAMAPAKITRGYDNVSPRAWAAGLTGFRARAYAAHQNGFEAFPLFAAAVILAEIQGVPRDAVDTLAVVWVGLRVAYIACYFANMATLRSVIWLAALATAVALLTSAAWLV